MTHIHEVECDRCGKRFPADTNKRSNIVERIYRRYTDQEVNEYDFCETCQSSFTAWMMKGKDK